MCIKIKIICSWNAVIESNVLCVKQLYIFLIQKSMFCFFKNVYKKIIKLKFWLIFFFFFVACLMIASLFTLNRLPLVCCKRLFSQAWYFTNLVEWVLGVFCGHKILGFGMMCYVFVTTGWYIQEINFSQHFFSFKICETQVLAKFKLFTVLSMFSLLFGVPFIINRAGVGSRIS